MSKHTLPLIAAFSLLGGALTHFGLQTFSPNPAFAQVEQATQTTATHHADPSTLAIVWTSADRDVAERMALMYTHASKRAQWFENVRLIIWGPSQKTLLENEDLQAKIKQMQDAGIRVEACIACANSYGFADDLKALGLPVLPMGKPLTDMAKDPDTVVMTF